MGPSPSQDSLLDARGPVRLADVLLLVRQCGAAEVQRSGELGPAVLVGRLPDDAQPTWTFKTRINVMPLPGAVREAGLSLDMLCWPLRRRGLASLVTSTVRIGRAPSNEVPIPHIDVSKLHARLQMDGSRATVSDMGSANGTAVNGSLLGKEQCVVLQNGDRVSFGPITVQFHGTERLLKMLAGPSA